MEVTKEHLNRYDEVLRQSDEIMVVLLHVKQKVVERKILRILRHAGIQEKWQKKRKRHV